MKKCDEVAMLDSCLNKSMSDEPLFVLCARDASAPAAVRVWADEYAARHPEANKAGTPAFHKVREAWALAKQMEQWRAARR